MRTPLPVFALLLTACDSGGDGAGEGETPHSAGVDAPTAYTYTPADEDTLAPGDLDLAAISDALQVALAELRQLNAAPVLTAYQGLLSAADTGCPAYYEQDGNTFWYAYCTADSGAYYGGYAFYTLYEDVDLLGDGNPWDAEVIYGTADMTDPTGSYQFHLGGSVYLAETVSADGALLWYSAAQGAFFSETPDVADTWLAEGQSPAMTLYAARYDQYGVNVLYMYGNSALSGAVTAMSTEGLAIYTYVPGIYPCAEEPAGSLAFRDTEGRWFEVTFDVNPETLQLNSGAVCDGCGAVRYKGEVLGEVCVDGSVMVDWEATPW